MQKEVGMLSLSVSHEKKKMNIDDETISANENSTSFVDSLRGSSRNDVTLFHGDVNDALVNKILKGLNTSK